VKVEVIGMAYDHGDLDHSSLMMMVVMVMVSLY
jgi:hypothetical protein